MIPYGGCLVKRSSDALWDVVLPLLLGMLGGPLAVFSGLGVAALVRWWG